MTVHTCDPGAWKVKAGASRPFSPIELMGGLLPGIDETLSEKIIINNDN